MLFDVIPVLLLFVSLATIFLVVGRRLPEISSLKVEDLVEAQTANTKRQLLVQRLEERLKTIAKTSWSKTANLRQTAGEKVATTYDWLKQMERNARFSNKSNKPENNLLEILKVANSEFRDKRWNEAEQLYLDVLRYDERNRDAYVGLGLTYKALEQYEDAKESLMFALKLDKQDTSSWLALAEVQIELSDMSGAIISYRELCDLKPEIMEYKIALGDLYMSTGESETALSIFEEVVKNEPSNPRGLDRLLEVAIVCKKKRLCQTTLRRLKKVNPENNKISDFEERINSLDN